VHALQIWALQSPLAQSFAAPHALPFAHGAHEAPPQSTSVSPASFTPSVQWVPLGAFVAPQVWAVASHVLASQLVGCGGQSVATRQATHVPLPSQTAPPLSEHGVAIGARLVPQQPFAHVLTTRSFARCSRSARCTGAPIATGRRPARAAATRAGARVARRPAAGGAPRPPRLRAPARAENQNADKQITGKLRSHYRPTTPDGGLARQARDVPKKPAAERGGAGRSQQAAAGSQTMDCWRNARLRRGVRRLV
jgi:hypothetical protein